MLAAIKDREESYRTGLKPGFLRDFPDHVLSNRFTNIRPTARQ